MVSRCSRRMMESKTVTIPNNDIKGNKMDTHNVNTNDPEEPTPKSIAIKYVSSNMVREWLKKLKTKKKATKKDKRPKKTKKDKMHKKNKR